MSVKNGQDETATVGSRSDGPTLKSKDWREMQENGSLLDAIYAPPAHSTGAASVSLCSILQARCYKRETEPILSP